MKSLSRVIKFGGSLLDGPERLASFCRWHDTLLPARSWLLVGGGAAVDRVRNEQNRWGLDDHQAHWLALRSMQQNALAMAALLGVSDPLQSWEAIREASVVPTRLPRVMQDCIVLVDILALLQRDPAVIPATWEITSDSLAAWLAGQLQCDSVFLMKSAIPQDDVSSIENSSYVDRQFWNYARAIPNVHFVNLRNPNFPACQFQRRLDTPSFDDAVSNA